jgi:D-alanyl-D-alanine carboxypeptidase
LALRLSRALGQTPQYWLNLQTTYDLKMAQIEMRYSLKQVQEIQRVEDCKGTATNFTPKAAHTLVIVSNRGCDVRRSAL